MSTNSARLEWRTEYAAHGVEPVAGSEMDYLLDGDDHVALRARASVFICPTDPLVADVAARAELDYDEASEILDGFWAALARAEGGEA